MNNKIDRVKQKSSNELLEEPLKGEDITKTWITAKQQATIISQLRQKAYAESYDRFRNDCIDIDSTKENTENDKNT